MKNLSKRILSLMLALILVASCVPAGVFAVGTEQTLNTATEVVYDFDLAGNYADTFTESGNFSLEDQLESVDSLYSAGTINWTFETKQNGTTDGAGTTPTDASFTRNQFYKGSGLRIYTSGYNWWYALRLKAPGTGNYNITVNTYLASGKHSMWTEAYLFDASLVTGSVTIDSFLNESNQLPDFAPTSADPDADLGSFAFTADKEYILVLRQTNATRVAANGDGLRTNNLYLDGITMSVVSSVPDETTTAPEETTTAPEETTTAPEETTTVPEVVLPPELESAGYDFDLKTWYDDIVTGNLSVEDAANIAYTQALYEAGKIDWLFAGKQNGNTKPDNTGDPAESIVKNYYSKGNGIQVNTSGYNWWYALRFRSPGSGTYDLTVNTYTVPSGDVQKHSLWTKAYLFDAALITGDTGINDLLVTDNQIDHFAPTTETPAAYLGNHTFEAGKEYILVLQMDNTVYVAGRGDGLSTQNLYLSDLSLVEAAPPPPPEVPAAGYDFDLKTWYDLNLVNGNFSVEDPANVEYISSLYDTDKVLWKFEAKKEGTVKEDPNSEARESFTKNEYYKGNGLRITAGGYNWWYAIRLKSPGTGTYDLTVNTYTVLSNEVDKHSLWAKAYLFDAALVTGNTGINDLLVKDNQIYNFTPTSENTAAYLGNHALEAGKEYILVFQMDPTVYNAGKADGLSTTNLYLTNMELVEADPPPPPEIPAAGYDFDLKTWYDIDLVAGEFSVEDADNQAYISELYAADKVLWKFEAKKDGTEKPDPTSNARESFTRNEYYKGNGLRINAGGYNWWYAIRLKAPGTGTYDIKIDTYTVLSKEVQKHAIWTRTYLFDAAKLSGNTDIDDLLTEDNRLYNFTPTSEETTAYIGNVAFTAGKEYILVFKMDPAVYSAGNADKASTSNLYLSKMTLEAAAPPPPPELPKTGYDFDLAGNYPMEFESKELSEYTSLMDSYYAQGAIDWNFYGFGVVEGSTGSSTSNRLSKASGIITYCSGYDWYYMIRFRSPGKGAHKVVLDTFLANAKDENGNPVQKHSMWANTYIMPVSELEKGTAPEDFMLKRNLLGMFAPTVDDPSAELGYYEFEAGKEYVLILRQTKATASASKEDGLSTNNLYLEGLSFTYTANPPKKVVDNSKVVYDFDLGDSKTGIYKSNTVISDKASDISRLYALGELNWEMASPTSSSDKFKGAGLSVYSNADDYVAFRIQSPGQGLYTLSLVHAQFGRGALGAVYILPADTEDILFAMDNSNRVGKLQFYNETGDTATTDGITSLVGTWEFGSAKEYIVVVEAFENSPYFSNAYMYFSQLICEKGDKTAAYQSTKQPKPVVVDPAPVKLMEVCTYQAVAEVNGDDYLFLPLEGKKMVVYNLDTKELVDYTDTSIGQVKGMAVDDEGIVWLVGDNPTIFRYDPYLNVGEAVLNYKNMSGVENTTSVIGAETAFGMTVGDDGCIYFGVSKVGVLGKYNTVTGEFTNMGKIGDIADANAYASAPCYKDGIVYVTTLGDLNSDGIKTVQLAKFDAVTGERLLVKDVTQYFSQDEVMVRGMGICGGVLIAGGEKQNDMKEVAAFDAETFEFIDLDVGSSAFYGPTGEMDGKVYFTTAKGLHEFDGATRTAKPVPGLENATNALRMGEDCFVTIEGNDQFPGKSIIQFRGSTLSPVVYNVKTGRTLVIEGMIQEGYGSTSNIRPVVKVPGESNLLYIGSFNTDNCSVYDVEAGQIAKNFETMGQTDAILVYQDKLYVGNYNKGVLCQVNTEDKNRNVPLLSLKSEYKQSRIHALAGGGGKVFLGSVPDLYETGGCLAWVDVETLEKFVVRHAIQDQSIVALTYHESGYVIAGGSIKGGSGALPKAESAKFAIFDVENQTKVAEYDLRDYFKDMPASITGIDGLTTDENGRIWMLANGILFSFTFDPAKKTIDIRKELDFSPFTRSDWFSSAMLQIDGYLYCNFGDIGGIRKVNMSDPSDNERLRVPATDYFAIGNDGNIYYTTGAASLWMYPLIVADADWEAAEKMDAVFAQLKNITLESETAIIEARAAYEALSWTQKALIYNLDMLVAAEIDLLECKIDSLGEITLEDKALIQEIKANYAQLSAKNKNYVKNYKSVFVPAMQALQALEDQQAAAEVQAMIDSIPGMGEITLEKEAAIREIEAAYNALTKAQKALVDAKLLEDALAKIQVLRQERIDYLNKLIANFGEITLEDEPAIEEAMDIFDWLTVTEREKVDYLTLNAAETALKKLQKAAAAAVDELIAAIGDSVSHSSGDAIAAARAAYDALTPGSKQYVKLLSILEEAEALYADLGLHPGIIIAIVAVVVIAAGATVLVVLRKKKAAGKSAETAPADTDA